MKVIIADSAKKCLKDIFDYNSRYSYKDSIETNNGILKYMQKLENMPYIR